MAETLGKAYLYLVADDTDLKKGLDQAETKARGFGGRVGGILKGALTGAVVGGGIAAAAAVAGIGKAAFDVSADTDKAAADMAASLGIPIEKAEEFAEVARRVYGNNFADDVNDASDAVAELVRNMGTNWDADVLQDYTEHAFRLRDAFGIDVADSIAAADTLMEEFGLVGSDAFDFIASGMQRGLNRNGDFLDSIGEYSNLFAESGLDAMQFYNIMESGQKGGVLGTDKISDAFKELFIRLNEGGKDVRGAFQAMDLDYDNFLQTVRDGDATWGDSTGFIVQKLAGIQDPIEQSRLAVALFGTQAEDLGASFLEGLNTSSRGLEDMEGAIDKIDAKYNTFGQAATAIWRRLVVAVSPYTDKLLEMVNDAMPHVMRAFDWFEREAIPAMDAFGSKVRQVVDFVRGLFQGLGQTIQHEGLERFAYLKLWIDRNMPLIRQIVETVVNAITGFWQNHGETVMAVVGNHLRSIGVIFDTVLKTILDLVQFVLQVLTGDWEGAGQTLVGIVQRLWDGISEIFRLQLDSIRTIFSQFDWGEIGRNLMDGIANGIRDGAGRIRDAAEDAARDALNAAKSWLGIRSPSRVAADQIGKPFAEGIGVGLEDQLGRMQRSFGAGLNSMVQSFGGAQPAMAGTTLNMTINVGGGASYQDGRNVGRGVADELRARGLRL